MISVPCLRKDMMSWASEVSRSIAGAPSSTSKALPIFTTKRLAEPKSLIVATVMGSDRRPLAVAFAVRLLTVSQFNRRGLGFGSGTIWQIAKHCIHQLLDPLTAHA